MLSCLTYRSKTRRSWITGKSRPEPEHASTGSPSPTTPAATDQRGSWFLDGSLSGLRRRLQDHELKPRHSGVPFITRLTGYGSLKLRANEDTSRNCLRSKRPQGARK